MPAGMPLLVTGIGKVAAAAAVARALAQQGRPEELIVVNIGTAGSLRPHIAGLLVPTTVLNHDISADVLAQLGFPVRAAIDLPGGDGTVLATGDSFVTEASLRAALAARAAIVDMEGFAVAWACREAGVACRVVKHVSDDADEGALDWPHRVDASARALGRWLESELGPEGPT